MKLAIFASQSLRTLIAVALPMIIVACSSSRPAPVIETRPQSGTASSKPTTPTTTQPTGSGAQVQKPGDLEKVHVIQKGDTMYSIAFQHGVDYRELAAWNNIVNPNVIKLGDTLRLTPPGSQIIAGTVNAPSVSATPVATPLIITPMPVGASTGGNSDKLKTEPRATKTPYSDAALARAQAEANAAPGSPVAAQVAPTPTTPPTPSSSASTSPAAANSSDTIDWAWPIQPAPKGKLLATFTDANKGIDIAGSKNTAVLAAAAGKVIYSAAGLRGYGRMVIIKHNDNWLSAYAHNEKILVQEDQVVKKGEKIAEMGNSDAEQVKLHFEIRKQGKPVDPIKLLPN